MGASASKTDNLAKKAAVLYGKLSSHILLQKLDALVKAQNQYELYSILKNIMLPCEMMYFVEKMLPTLLQARNNKVGGDSIEDHMVAKYTTYVTIYKKLLDNADTIVKMIDKLQTTVPTSAPTVLSAGNRVARKKKTKV